MPHADATTRVGAPTPPDDGYRWRKYGQKAIKGAPYARSYYRCTVHNCPARKKLECAPCGEGEVTYEHEHTHEKPRERREKEPRTSEDSMTNDSLTASEDDGRGRGRRRNEGRRKRDSNSKGNVSNGISNGKIKMPMSMTPPSSTTTTGVREIVTPDVRGEKRAKTMETTPERSSAKSSAKSSATKTIKRRVDDTRSRKKFAESQRRFELKMEEVKRIDRDQRRREKALLAAEKSFAMSGPLSPLFAKLEDVSRLFAESDARDHHWNFDLHVGGRRVHGDSALHDRVDQRRVGKRPTMPPPDAHLVSPPMSPVWPYGDADLETRLRQTRHIRDDDVVANEDNSCDDGVDRCANADAASTFAHVTSAARRPPALCVAESQPDWTLKSPLDYLKSPFESVLAGTPLLSSLSKAAKFWCESPAIGALSPLGAFEHLTSPRAGPSDASHGRWTWWH